MNALKKVRETAGMSQTNLAEASGISVRMIQEYEQGRKSIEKAEAWKVVKIAKALGTTVEELLK